MRRFLVLTFLGALGLVAGASWADAPEAPGSLGGLLERIRERQREVQTLTARFVQIRTSELLAAPERSEGQLWYARPDRARWEYRTPRAVSLWIDRERMVTWFHDLGRAEERRIGRSSSQALRYLHAPQALAELEQYFTVTLATPPVPQPYRLELRPRFARLERRIRELRLWIDRQQFLPVRIEFQDPRGQRTEYQFFDLEIDRPIPPRQFEPELPQHVALFQVGPGNPAGSAAPR